MSVTCTFYDEATGAYAKSVMAPDMENLLLNHEAGQILIEGEFAENSYLKDGTVWQLPDRPVGSFWAFDYAQELWLDPRTPADRQAALYAARAAAKADKSDLLMALRSIGILNGSEAVQAALGQVPASFEAAIAALPGNAQDLARIKWAGDQQISRMNPLIVLAAYARDITDDQLDRVFGVQIPD